MDSQLIILTHILEKELYRLELQRKREEKAFKELKNYLKMDSLLQNRDAVISEAKETLGKKILKSHTNKE